MLGRLVCSPSFTLYQYMMAVVKTCHIMPVVWRRISTCTQPQGRVVGMVAVLPPLVVGWVTSLCRCARLLLQQPVQWSGAGWQHLSRSRGCAGCSRCNHLRWVVGGCMCDLRAGCSSCCMLGQQAGLLFEGCCAGRLHCREA